MRIRSLLLIFALAAGGCGWWFGDPDPTEHEEFHSVEAGRDVEGEHLLGHLDDDGYGWDETVRWLPDGFDYDTEDLFINSFDELWVEYEIDVAHWVAPGVYEFRVDYEVWEAFVFGWVWEYQIHFTVQVVPISDGPAAADLRILSTTWAEPLAGSGPPERRAR